jgi:soluble lytic murein transglycosylase-like protein
MQVNGMEDSTPEASIDRGTSMLANYVKKYKSIELALAAYNMGPGVVDYMKKKGISDVRQGMASFSSYMKAKNGYKVYGDPNYIDNVLRYYA